MDTQTTLHDTAKQSILSQDQLNAMVDLHNRFLIGRLGGRRAILQNFDISGLSFAGKDLRQVDFSGCSMLDMDLSGANFQEAKLYACDLSGSDLSECNFIRADLRGSRIEFANLKNTNLNKADLRIGGIVRDGEGATKFVTINVTGAASDSDARLVAMSTANSPLVKTAIAGEDPNWGRIVAAVGKSGAAADRDLLTIHFGDVLVAENGWVAPSYTEEAGAALMKEQDITINIGLGLGDGKCTVWTCDLTHQYITINADYRS